MSIESAKQTPVPDTKKKEWSFLGINRADYVKISIGFLISASICLFAFWVNWRSPRLKFTVPDITVFSGDKDKFGIMNVTVSNDGSKEAEEVECWLDLSGSKIQEVKASPEHLNAVVTSKADKVKVDVHLLNPKEELTIAAVITNPDKLPERAKVEVRGKGVIGEDAKYHPARWVVVLGSSLVAFGNILAAGGIISIFGIVIVLRSIRLRKLIMESANEAVPQPIVNSDLLINDLSGSRQQRLEKVCNDALSKIGEQLEKDSLDEPTKQKALEYIKKYFDDLK